MRTWKSIHSVSWKDEYGKRYTISGISYDEARSLFRWIQNQQGFTVLEHEVYHA